MQQSAKLNALTMVPLLVDLVSLPSYPRLAAFVVRDVVQIFESLGAQYSLFACRLILALTAPGSK